MNDEAVLKFPQVATTIVEHRSVVPVATHMPHRNSTVTRDVVVHRLPVHVRDAFKAARQHLADLLAALHHSAVAFIAEMFGGVQTLKVAHAEAGAIRHFRMLNERARKAQLKENLFVQTLDTFNRNTANITAGIILLLAAQALRANTFTVGDFTLFVAYLGPISMVPRWFGLIMMRYRQSEVSLERMNELLPTAPHDQLMKDEPLYLSGSIPDVPQTIKTHADRLRALEVAGLTYIHPTAGRGIRDVNFRVARGSFTVITGRIGSGKTTLLRALLGLLDKNAGEIYWNDERVDDPSTYFLPPRVAYTGGMAMGLMMVLTGCALWFKHQLPWLVTLLGGARGATMMPTRGSTERAKCFAR